MSGSEDDNKAMERMIPALKKERERREAMAKRVLEFFSTPVDEKSVDPTAAPEGDKP
jgi:hypothetical protein